MTNTFRYFALIFIALGAMALSCRTPMPSQPGTPPGHTALTLKATAVSTRWATLQWNNDSSAVSHSYVLLRNGKDTVYNGTVLKTVDSIMAKDSALTPGTSYQYSLYRIYQNQHWDSATCAVTMLDTSRYNFSFTTTTFPGELYSVWSAGNPNSVWMGGGGNVDSGGNKIGWGVIHYLNGQFFYYNSSIVGSARGIYGLSDSNVWFANGGLAFWNGSQFIDYPFTGLDPTLPNIYPNGIYTVWCAADGEVWGGGDSGIVIHRKTNGTWEVQRTPTTLSLNSIEGFSDGTIIAAGGYSDIQGVLLQYKGSTWTTLLNSNYPDSTVNVANMAAYGDSPDSLYLIGNGIFHRHGSGWLNVTPESDDYYLDCLCTRGWNAVYVAGAEGYAAVFDGDRWWSFVSQLPGYATLNFYGIYAAGGQLFLVGSDNTNAVFARGQ